jgi:large conductance mechanosensitive channel
MLKDFRDFIARGNVMDLAVGIIIGAAFTAIVNSLVADLINPLIGLFLGNVDFSNLFIALSTDPFPNAAAAEQAGVAVFRYGSFLTSVINFLIIAWVVFLLVRFLNKIQTIAKKKDEGTVEVTAPTQEQLLAEIRDILRTDVAAIKDVPLIKTAP